jgi:hypothetical protein
MAHVTSTATSSCLLRKSWRNRSGRVATFPTGGTTGRCLFNQGGVPTCLRPAGAVHTGSRRRQAAASAPAASRHGSDGEYATSSIIPAVRLLFGRHSLAASLRQPRMMSSGRWRQQSWEPWKNRQHGPMQPSAALPLAPLRVQRIIHDIRSSVIRSGALTGKSKNGSAGNAAMVVGVEVRVPSPGLSARPCPAVLDQRRRAPMPTPLGCGLRPALSGVRSRPAAGPSPPAAKHRGHW